MLAPFASMQLESDLPRFGNPNRFNPVGKCSNCAGNPPAWAGEFLESRAEGTAFAESEAATSLAERGRKIIRAQLRILLAGLTKLAQRYQSNRRIACSLIPQPRSKNKAQFAQFELDFGESCRVARGSM